MNLGARTSEEDSHRIMARALELGMNFFDTANRYRTDVENGYTESIIVRWLTKSGHRDQIVLATKFFGPTGGFRPTGSISTRCTISTAVCRN